MTEHWENEGQIVEATDEPITRKSLVEDFRKAGINPGDTIIVHSSMRTILMIQNCSNDLLHGHYIFKK